MGDAMAERDPLLDEELTDEDRRTVADIESNAPQPDLGPDPADLDEIAPPPPVAPPLDLTPPEIGSEGPTRQEPLPGRAPSPPTPEPSSEDIIRRQGVVDAENAHIQKATADRVAQEAQKADEDARLERADYLQRRQDAERDLDPRTKKYGDAKLVDPRERTNSVKATLAVIFGGLGAALSAAGGGSSQNRGLEALQKRWEDDTALQKANIAALRDSAVMARTRLEDVDAGRREMLRDADARLLAKYHLALKQGEAQLKGQGATQAEIDADGRIVKLRAGQAAAKLQAAKDADAHALNQARIARLNAQAAKDAQRKGKGGGGMSRKQQLAERRADLADKREVRAEAAPVIKEMDESLKEFKAKGGVKESLEHSERALAAVDKAPDDPTNWVNLVDAMIRSNTGRSAILSQYKLYTGKAAGTLDVAAQFFHHTIDGGLSDAQKSNL